MKKSQQKVTNKENSSKENIQYAGVKNKYGSVRSEHQKDSLYDYNTLIENYNEARERQFIQDGIRKDSELPKYNMLNDKYLNHFFVSPQRSQQLLQLGVLKQQVINEDEGVQCPKRNNLMSQSKYKCLSKSQQLSKDCKVFIDKYLKQNQLQDKSQQDKFQKSSNLSKQNTLQKQPIAIDNSSSNNSLNYAIVRNQIVGLRFQNEQKKENTEIKQKQNGSLQTSKFFSQQNSSRKQQSISPIPHIKSKREKNEDISIKGFSPTKEQDTNPIKQQEEQYQKTQKTEDNQMSEVEKLNERQISIEKDLRQNSKSKQQFQRQQNPKKFILKPIVKQAPLSNEETKIKENKFDQNKQSRISQRNSVKEVFYNEHEQKFSEMQKKKVIEVYNRNYSPSRKLIHPKSLERLYSTNQPQKPRVHENSVIQTLSRSEFLEFLKTNNEKIRQKNKIPSTSKIGSKSYLQTEQDLDKRSIKHKTLQSFSQIPSQQQINIKSQSKLPEEENKIAQEQVQSKDQSQIQVKNKSNNQ